LSLGPKRKHNAVYIQLVTLDSINVVFGLHGFQSFECQGSLVRVSAAAPSYQFFSV
jgi:hypothetical protein